MKVLATEGPKRVPGVVNDNDRRYRVCMLIRAVIPFGGMCEVGSGAR